MMTPEEFERWKLDRANGRRSAFDSNTFSLLIDYAAALQAEVAELRKRIEPVVPMSDKDVEIFLKAKCPCCESGCDKCHQGFVNVRLAEGGTWWTRVCQNQSECGFVNGGCWADDEHPLGDSRPCVECGGPTDWQSLETAASSEAWTKPENALKWEQKRHQKTLDHYRQFAKGVRALSVEILNGKTDLSLDDCRLLDICRVCRKPQRGPFIYNYGAEFAHSACLKEHTDGR